MPDTLGPFRADGAAQTTRTEGHAVVMRHYVADGREATLRALDVSREPALVRAFETALSLDVRTDLEVSKPVAIAGERATLAWSRETGESSVEVLVANKLLLSLNIWPANTRDEAVTRFPTTFVEHVAEAP